jgi:hypothetical protein
MLHPAPMTDSPKTTAAPDRAHHTAFVLYEGRVTPHRSCGIALAETFGVPSAAYQALRRGGITGEGECGAIKAGELVLGQLLGDPDPTGMVTPRLRSAMQHFQQQARARLALGAQDAPRRSEAAARNLPLAQVPWNIQCNHLTAPHGDFMGEARKGFCTGLAADVARLVAESLEHVGETPRVTDPPARP